MTHSIAEIAIAISESFLLSLAVKATVVTALALIAARMARGTRASVRHLLWMAAFAVLLALPGGVLVAPSIQIEIPGNPQPEQAMPVMQVPAAVAAIVTNAAVPRPQAGENTNVSIPVPMALATIWIIGVFVFAALMAVGLWQLHRIRRCALPWLKGEAILRDLAQASGIKRNVELVLHAAVSGPITCGILRPAIICPVDAQTWSHADLQRALIHELEHAVRADCLTHCIARLVCAIYWFHPLVWMSWRRLSLEAERACDDAVLKRAEAADYADQLLTLAQRMSSRAKMPVLAMANRSDLTRRVTSVLNARQRRGRPGTSRTAAATAATVLLIATIVPLRAVGRIPQTPAGEKRLEFEVAAVKKNISQSESASFSGGRGGLIAVTNNTLRNIIRNVWGVQNFQIVGGPDWINEDRWDINAKASESFVQQQQPQQQQQQQLMLMMRTMLADRFKLAVHDEKREMPVYALVLARSDGKFGPQLKRSEVDCNALAEAYRRGQATAPPPSPDRPFCGTRTGRGSVMTSGVKMADFARNLSPSTGRIVVDKTGLTGAFDLDLKFTPDPLGPGVGDPSLDVPSLFVAIQEQLGLRIEATRTPVDVLVIDSAEKPTEN